MNRLSSTAYAMAAARVPRLGLRRSSEGHLGARRVAAGPMGRRGLGGAWSVVDKTGAGAAGLDNGSGVGAHAPGKKRPAPASAADHRIPIESPDSLTMSNSRLSAEGDGYALPDRK